LHTDGDDLFLRFCHASRDFPDEGSNARISDHSGRYQSDLLWGRDCKSSWGSGQNRKYRLLAKIEKFTYDGYVKCVTDLVTALLPRPAGQTTCRDPSLGVARYAREFDVNRDSGWRGGGTGYSTGNWCNELIAALRGEHPYGDFRIVTSSENQKNACSPLIARNTSIIALCM
jgi:hypothetical protein